MTPSAHPIPRTCPVSKWSATACSIAAIALACSDSAERQWGSPDTSLDLTDHATDAGFHWRAPSSSDGSWNGDAGLAPDGACGTDGGCATAANEPQSLTQEYTGECEGDGVVQWGFFTYEATTPGDSSVAFRVRTGATRDELGRASWTNLITAQATPDTQVCSFFGPAPCPIDLYTVLEGAPRAHHAFAELRVILTPTSDGAAMPSVQSWNLNYSCPLSL